MPILEQILQLAKHGQVDFSFDDSVDLSQENLQLLHQILISPHVSIALLMLQRTKILHQLIPDFQDVVNLTNETLFGQNKHLFKEIWPHTIQVVTQTPPKLIIRWAALFHDFGKVTTFSIKKGKVSFHQHEYYSAKIFSKFNYKTRIFTRKQYDQIYQLILHLGYLEEYDKNWSDSAIRRISTNLNDILPDLIELSKADITTKNESKKRKIIENIEDFEKKIIQIRTKDEDDKSKLPKGIGLLIAERFKVEGKGIGTLRELLDAKIKEQVLLPLQTPEYYLGYLEIEKAKKPIHFCAYSSQPDIQIFCDDSWTTPSWTQQPKTIPEVYLADNQELYTFNRELVTCDKCKEKNNDNIDN